LHLSSEIRTTRPRYRYRIRIPRANGWRKRSYRTSPSRAWRPLLSAVVDQHLLERVPGHLPRVGLPAIRWPSSAPRVRCSVLKRTRLSGVRPICHRGRTRIDREQPRQRSRGASERPVHKERIRKRGGRLGRARRTSGADRRGEVSPYATKKIIARSANRHISGTFWDYTCTITGCGISPSGAGG
jgi:hypothetical protein